MARVDEDQWAGEPMAELILAAFHASPNGVVLQRPAGTIVAANDAAERILGLAAEELRGRTSLDPRWQAVSTDGRLLPGEMHPAMKALRNKEAVRDAVMSVETPDGHRRWVSVNSIPIVAEGELRGVASFFVDTTAQRGSEGALLRANDRLRVATEAGRVGLFEWDPTREMIWWDEGAAIIVGRAELSMRGPLEALLTAVHPEDRDRARHEMRTALTTLSPSSGTYRVVRPDGSVRSITVQAGVASSAGESQRLTGAIVDVTELHAAHERVVELLESMPEAYLTLDERYRVTYVNPTAERLLGHDQDDLVGRVIWDEFPEAAGSEFEHHYRSSLTTGRPVEFESFYPPHGRWYEVRAHVVPSGLAVYFRDVSDRHAAEAECERLLRGERAARDAAEQARAELAHLAAHDVLTGLPNRLSLATWLTDRLTKLRRGRVLAVCYVDLDRFKLVNDCWGHSEGDRLLVEAAHRMRTALRNGDFLARLGGDEFVVVVEGTTQGNLLDLTRRFAETLREPFDLGGRRVVVTASVGVAFAGRDTDAEMLVRDADAALYRAKEAGRDQIIVFDDAIRGAVLARIEIEADLRAALSAGAIVPHYQPAFSLATGQVVGVEALARWNHPVRGDVAPSEFIPVAEETGLIAELGTGILRCAVRDGDAVAAATANPDLVMWVNVSPRQLSGSGLIDTILGMVEDRRISGRRLGIEVTETALLDDSPAIRSTLDRLADCGVHVAIDDFGTGHSSLARLSDYPVDLLKVDRSVDEGEAVTVVESDLEVPSGLVTGRVKRRQSHGVELTKREAQQVTQKSGVEHLCGSHSRPGIEDQCVVRRSHRDDGCRRIGERELLEHVGPTVHAPVDDQRLGRTEGRVARLEHAGGGGQLQISMSLTVQSAVRQATTAHRYGRVRARPESPDESALMAVEPDTCESIPVVLHPAVAVMYRWGRRVLAAGAAICRSDGAPPMGPGQRQPWPRLRRVTSRRTTTRSPPASTAPPTIARNGSRSVKASASRPAELPVDAWRGLPWPSAFVPASTSSWSSSTN